MGNGLGAYVGQEVVDYAAAKWLLLGAVPGVVVGGTIGTRVGKYVPADTMEIGLGVIFGAVGVLVLGVEFVVWSASRDEGIAECRR